MRALCAHERVPRARRAPPRQPGQRRRPRVASELRLVEHAAVCPVGGERSSWGRIFAYWFDRPAARGLAAMRWPGLFAS